MTNKYITGFEDLNQTEFNSNQLVILRINECLRNFNRALSMRAYYEAFMQLESFYFEIIPKVREFKKKDDDNAIQPIRKSIRGMIRHYEGVENIKQSRGSVGNNLNTQLCDYCELLQIASNKIGMGMKTKDGGRGAL